MIEFANKILFVGYGAVAQCTLPILVKHVKVPLENITVMDFEDRAAQLEAVDRPRACASSATASREENLGALLGKYLSAGDLLIDLAWNIDCREILQWCHDHGVLYVNTSVELWDPYAGAANKHPTERTLYWRHMNIRRHDGRLEGAGPDGRPRARRQPRPDLALHQAGPARHRRAPARRQEGQGPQGARRSAQLIARPARSTTWP